MGRPDGGLHRREPVPAGPIPLDREGQEYVARRAGCDTWPRVTKKVHACVTADPNDLTGNLRKAEEYGLEIVREPDFWAGIGIPLSGGSDGALPG